MEDIRNRSGRKVLRRPSGGILITDPARKAILNPGPSKACLETIERLERATRRGCR